MKNEVDGRREIASRNTAWANNIARKLTRWGVTPNQISMMSVFFAMVGCLLLIGTVIYPGFNKYVAYILFIVCMQSRLLCNLFDGMVAIEGGKKSANGDLYNDMPDRFVHHSRRVCSRWIRSRIGMAGRPSCCYDSLFPLDRSL